MAGTLKKLVRNSCSKYSKIFSRNSLIYQSRGRVSFSSTKVCRYISSEPSANSPIRHNTMPLLVEQSTAHHLITKFLAWERLAVLIPVHLCGSLNVPMSQRPDCVLLCKGLLLPFANGTYFNESIAMIQVCPPWSKKSLSV